jgi:3-dehydroquinate dehydratase
MKILMLHGINHNMFGKRDPAQYGTITLDETNAGLSALGQELGVEIEAFRHVSVFADSYLLALRAGVSAAKAIKAA